LVLPRGEVLRGEWIPSSALIGLIGLFVPKPSTDADCQRRNTRGLGQTVRRCPLTSTGGRGDCRSLRHSAAREPVV